MRACVTNSHSSGFLTPGHELLNASEQSCFIPFRLPGMGDSPLDGGPLDGGPLDGGDGGDGGPLQFTYWVSNK